MRQVAYGFVIVAMAGVLLGLPVEFIEFLVLAAVLLALFAPSKQHRDARRRNHAHRVR
jgi:membrane protein implicated in regulation of membrane protease activity